MNKVWMGYISSLLFLMAGIMMIIGDKAILGIVFIVLAIANTVLQVFMNSGGK